MDTRERIILELKKRAEELAVLLRNSCKEQLLCSDFCIGCEENSDDDGNCECIREMNMIMNEVKELCEMKRVFKGNLK